MERHTKGAAALSLVVALLTGCGSAEDRINAAMPLGADVLAAKEAFDRTAAAASIDAKSADAEYRARLRMRALECARGFEPSLLDTRDSIRESLGDTRCFTEADAELKTWLSVRRAAWLAAMPPLRAAGKTVPGVIAASDRIESVVPAQAAAVALLQLGDRYELVDLSDGSVIRSGGERLAVPSLSPNGRVLAVRKSGAIDVVDAEAGDTLASFPARGSDRAFWLDGHGLVYRVGSGEQLAYFDLASATESNIPLAGYGPSAVERVPGDAERYVLVGGERAGLVDLACVAAKCTPKLVQEARIGPTLHRDFGAALAGRGLIQPGSAGLQRINVDTLQANTIEFGPMRVMQLQRTADPDRLLVTGFGGSGDLGMYLLSLSRGTLAAVRTRELLSSRTAYLPALRVSVVIDGAKLVPIRQWPTDAPRPLASLVSEWQLQAQTERLEQAARVEQAALLRPRGAAPDAVGGAWSMAGADAGWAGIEDAAASLAPGESVTFGASGARRSSGRAPPALPPSRAGLAEAVRTGRLRLGNAGDIDTWKRSYRVKTGRDVGKSFDGMLRGLPTYVITRELTLPAGLTGANLAVFVRPAGAPFPRGDAGHSVILDVASGACQGSLCRNLVP